MTPSRVRRILTLAGLIAVLALLLAFLWPANSTVPGNIVWLSQPEAVKALQHGKLREFKFKLLRMSRFGWKWYQQRRTMVNINARFMATSDEVSLRNHLPPQPFHGSEGIQAWILTAEQWASLRQWCLGDDYRLSTATSSRITMIDDSQAVVSSGTTAANTAVAVFPTIGHGSFNLLLRATSTFNAGTNFAMACRAVIPNGGALVVRPRPSRDLQATNYWLMISIGAVDALGNPKKL